MGASYTLIPKLQTPGIDPGEDIEIDIYLTGWGSTARNKLGIVHSHPDAYYDAEDPGTLFDRVSEEPWTGETVWLPDDRAKFDLNRVGTFGSFSPAYFSELPDHEPPGHELPSLFSEDHHEFGAPLSVELHTSGDIVPGDHEVRFILTYVTGGEVRQDDRTVTVHVRPWWEHHRRVLQLAGIVVGVLTLVVTAVGLLSP